MLYNNFIICMMTCAFFALLTMISNQEWHYIILPIGIFIWGIFKFFDEDDKEYMRRHGIDPDDYSIFFSDDYGKKYPINNTIHHTSATYPRREGNTITWDNRREDTFDYDLYKGVQSDHTRYQPSPYGGYQNPAYKGMVKKCKRNFKITLDDKEKDGTKSERKSIFHGSYNFGLGG